MKKWFVRILPKAEVLDVQGRTVLQMLRNQQLPFEGARVGKWIELELPDSVQNPEEVLKKALKAGLYNPLIETADITKDPS
ncbi:MAG: phosphoribosylformylglycinamidine synthase subunit PurS [Bdellovibrionales bacterium]